MSIYGQGCHIRSELGAFMRGIVGIYAKFL
jgi:hypothetical protein